MEQGGLDLIMPLWEKLRLHHLGVSSYFKNHYNAVTLDLRKKQLVEKSQNGALRVDLARNWDTKEYIGYCVTSITPEKQGEIDSIYIEKNYRGLGIGDELMTRALKWLDARSVKKKILGVGEGNEGVFAFYRRYHFYPRTTILEQKPGYYSDSLTKQP
jgi:ribosomal protein S18 acetylase RimI-like enzyme